jgi:hypothetical protein
LTDRRFTLVRRSTPDNAPAAHHPRGAAGPRARLQRTRTLHLPLIGVVACLLAAPSAQADTINPVKGKSWSGIVGSSGERCPRDPDLPRPNTPNCDLLGPDSSLRATINWGDGTSVDATAAASRSCARFTCSILVAGTHTYTASGTFHGSFTWTDSDPVYPGRGSGTFTATVTSVAASRLQTIGFNGLVPSTTVSPAAETQGVAFGVS